MTPAWFGFLSRIGFLGRDRRDIRLEGVRLASAPFGITERTASGGQRVTMRRGPIRVWLKEDQRGVPFVFPISYVDNIPSTVVPLLGLGDVIAQLRWIFDGRPFPESRYGYCRLIDCRPVRDRFPK